jgi:hypothetical protein
MLMIGLIVLILFAGAEPSRVIQDKNFWHVLAEVGFRKEQKDGYEMEVPLFSKHLKSWDGKKIKLKGYVIPVGEVGDESKFMFSSLPFNVCYFCGAAGPETIMEVEATQKVKFTSQAIWMEGILHLNEKNPDRHIYILKSANVITP